MPQRNLNPKPWLAPVADDEPIPDEAIVCPDVPAHFNEAEVAAWMDVTSHLVRRKAWRDELALWAEVFAGLLAKHRCCQKVNIGQLRLMTKDLDWYCCNAPEPEVENPFKDL